MRPEELQAYLDAVGLAARRPDLSPSRAALDDLVRAHVSTFPFASVGVRLGDDLPLTSSAVHRRIVLARRGGYCFEQNLLMHDVLDALGYDVTMYLGRVLVSGNPHPPLTHRVTVVDLDDEVLLVDVGFGPQGPTAAVPFDGTLVGLPWRRFGMEQTGPAAYTTYGGRDDDLSPMYRFELAGYGPADCELGHFYSHRHPESHFVRTLVASTLLESRTRSLRGRDYWVIGPDGADQRVLADADELHEVLVGDFGLRVDPGESRRLFDREGAGT